MVTPHGVFDIDLQCYNAIVHFQKTDIIWGGITELYYQQSGISFNLLNQPARSPDLNICDLSICNVLQTIQRDYDGQLKNVQDVIHAVNYAWREFNDRQLEFSFCTLQTVFDSIIKCQGGSQYKLRHIKKHAIWREHGIHFLREQAEQASQDAVDLVEEVFGV